MTHPAETPAPALDLPLGDPPLVDRETSWLAFNERVLEEAWDPENPLLERMRFLTIFHTNLDEFFMIRVSGVKQQIAAGLEVLSHQGQTPRQRLASLSVGVHAALASAERCLERLLEELEAAGVALCRFHELGPREQQRWQAEFFDRVHPTLTPLAVSPAFPFPFISNLSLNLGVFVTSPEGERRLARIKIPDHLPRLVVVDPDAPDAAPIRLMTAESLIKAHISSLFPGMTVGAPFTFRVTRDADVEIREDEADDLLKYIEEEMRKRRFGQAVRLEVDKSAPNDMIEELQLGLGVDEADTFRVRGILNPADLSRMISVERPQLKYAPFAARKLPGVDDGIFEAIRQGDLLVHHPFDSFSPVAEFVRQAARDPAVLTIKQTLYRTSGDSPVIGALLEAVEAGKQVAAVVELKARFDEVNNIVWSRRLEEAGVHVIYGVPGLKTHAKLSLVVRREEDGLRRYAHVGTGNYNPITARVYTDLGLFTCDPDLTADVADLFNRITGFARPERYRKAFVAPRFMARRLIDLIRFETDEAAAGRPGRIILKCNAVIEIGIVEALYEASRAGVEIDLLVRGISGIVPGIQGLSERIRVRSVVGRFLEHSRCFWFGHGGDPQVYIGSADLMGRNLHRRIEVLVPIESPRHKRWLRDVYLQRYLDDVGRTRVMQSDGSWVRLRDQLGRSEPDVHQQFLADIRPRRSKS